jgi:hypothetical protein
MIMQEECTASWYVSGILGFILPMLFIITPPAFGSRLRSVGRARSRYWCMTRLKVYNIIV